MLPFKNMYKLQAALLIMVSGYSKINVIMKVIM